MNWRFLRPVPWLDTRAAFVASTPPGGALLDLGSSDGETLGHIAELRPDLRLFAADLAGQPERYPRGCEFARVDLEQQPLPWADGGMDAITCMHLVEHLRELTLLFREVARLLKPGGRVYFETPHPRSLTLPSLRASRKPSLDGSPGEISPKPSSRFEPPNPGSAGTLPAGVTADSSHAPAGCRRSQVHGELRPPTLDAQRSHEPERGIHSASTPQRVGTVKRNEFRAPEQVRGEDVQPPPRDQGSGFDFTLNFHDDSTHVAIVPVAKLAEASQAAGLEICGSGISRNWLFAALHPAFKFLPPSRQKYTAQVHWLGWSAWLSARRPLPARLS
jgi:hypothetical protein